MNVTFSLKRIGHILRADWIEYRQNLLLYSLAVLGGFVLLMYFNWKQVPVYHFVLLILAVSYCRFVNLKIHRSKGAYLSLPASTEEKYISLLLEGVFFFLAYQAVFWSAAGIDRVITGELIVKWQSLYNFPAVFYLSNFLYFTILLLCYVIFRKHALVIFLAGFITITGTMSYFFVKYFKDMIIEGEGKGVNINTDDFFVPFSYLESYYHVTTYLLIAIVLFLVYYKLRKKQVR